MRAACLLLGVVFWLASCCDGLHVVVAGATSKVGREVVRILRRQGVSHTALTRDLLKAKRLLGIRTKCKSVDLDVEDGRLEEALGKGDDSFRLFLACANGPTQAAQEARLIATAAATGRCEHVVKLSVCSPLLETLTAHAAGEAALAQYFGSKWTVLRPNLFTETLIAEDSALGLTLGADGKHVLANAKVSMISAVDVAAVACRILVADDCAVHKERILELTGPAATTLADVAAKACDVQIRSQPVEAHLAFLPTSLANITSHFLMKLASNACSVLTTHVADVLGEPPRSSDETFLRELQRRAMDSGNSNAAYRSSNAAYNERPVWTANYRKQLPFDDVRRQAQSMGLMTEADWKDQLEVADRNSKYAPSRPQDMYPDAWQGWDDFLGTRRQYVDACKLARTLGINSELRWYSYAYDHPAVLQDLRLPFKPSLVYGKDFQGWDNWLGLDRV